jgi:hypothetical protein
MPHASDQASVTIVWIIEQYDIRILLSLLPRLKFRQDFQTLDSR